MRPPHKLYGKFSAEKVLIEKHYAFIKCSYTNDRLTCRGCCIPTNIEYTYKIVYNGFDNPTITVVSPVIPFHKDIHMYSDTNGLCLHYPKDGDWTAHKPLYSTIIPWIHEWFMYYELYLITGRWEHPYVDHTTLKNVPAAD